MPISTTAAPFKLDPNFSRGQTPLTPSYILLLIISLCNSLAPELQVAAAIKASK